eukprot:g4055.t1
MRAYVFARSLPWSYMRPKKTNANRVRCKANQSSSRTNLQSLSFGGPKEFLISSLVSSAFGAAGDLVSQLLISRFSTEKELKIDALRILRMAGFGFMLYGPFQHVWYRTLGYFYPTRALTHFLPKLILNQVVLGPIAVTMTFVWVFTLTKQTSLLAQKFSHDFIPTMVNGWKFWVPAAAVNFTVIPVQLQVFYMSFCSLCWTAYLGYQANKPSSMLK